MYKVLCLMNAVVELFIMVISRVIVTTLSRWLQMTKLVNRQPHAEVGKG